MPKLRFSALTLLPSTRYWSRYQLGNWFWVVLLMLSNTFTHSQAWESYGTVQLPELPFINMNCMARSESGVYVAGSGGIAYWDFEDRKFSFLGSLQYSNVTKIQTTESGLYALTDQGKLFLINSGANQINPSDSIVDLISDFSLSDNSLAFATKLNGVFIKTGNQITQLNDSNSFLGENSIRTVTHFDEKLYCGGNQGLYAEGKNALNTSNGLLGNQVYALAAFKTELFIATEGGVQILQNGKMSEVRVSDEVIRDVVKFQMTNKWPTIITESGSYERTFEGWQQILKVDESEGLVADIISKGTQSFVAYRYGGVDIWFDNHRLSYGFFPSYWSPQAVAFAPGNETIYGLTSNRWLFYHDAILDRFKMKQFLPYSGSFRTLKVNDRDEVFVLTTKGCYDVKSDTFFHFNDSYNDHIDRFFFFDPTSGRPAYTTHRTRIFTLRESGFQTVPYGPIILHDELVIAKNATDDQVLFLTRDNVYSWRPKDMDKGILSLEEIKDVKPNFYTNFTRTGRDSVLFHSYEFFDYKLPYEQKRFHEAPISGGPGTKIYAIGGHKILTPSTTEAIARILSLDDFEVIDSISLPRQNSQAPSSSHVNTTFFKENTLYVGYRDQLYFYKLQEYKVNPFPKPFLCYPNPVNSYLQVQLSLPEKSLTTVEVHTLEGRLVHRESLTISGVRETVVLNTANFQPGVHILSLTSGDDRYVEKFVKN